jgi:hypothetical protein
MFRHDALVGLRNAFDAILQRISQGRHLRAHDIIARRLQEMSGMGGQGDGLSHIIEVTAHIGVSLLSGSMVAGLSGVSPD